MPFPVSVPYVFGSLTGIVPASDLDANFTPIVNALNGINNGTYPLSSVSVTGGTWQGSPIGVSYGGTGLSSTPTNGQLLIGNGSGYTLSTISAGSGISVTNTAGGISIAVAGGASGTVTSVNASGGTTGLTFTGGPVTSSGTLTLSGTLAVANGGTGVTTSTGLGNVVLSTSPTLVTPALGTPTSVTLTNATGLPLSTGVTGTLASANGGTGFGTYTKGDIIYASTTNTLSKLGVGTDGYVLKLTSGVPSWQAASSSLAVGTSAITGGTTGQILYDNAGVVGEKATTGSGNVVLDTGAVITLTNATGLPLTTGVTGTLPVANGGTNITTYATGDILYASATNTLSKLAAGTNGYVLTLAAGVPTWAAGGGSSAITINTTTITGGTTGRVLYDNAGTVGELANTGTGNNVLATSPTLVTPILGTPTSVTLTNGTGLPLSTGVTGTLGTSNGGTGLTGFTAANNAIYSTSSSALTAGTLPILAGGTGATTASTALSNLGGASTGKAIAMSIVFGGG